ncbi:MAG: ComEC/Rec2 family competence protein [SAR324 cluster bacterium]|nr:ComEC/Rec2 family competence protein [SAR324 cluster bacterium]
MEWLLLFAMGMGSWCWYLRLRTIAGFFFLGSFLLVYHLFFLLPEWQHRLDAYSIDTPPVWIQGTVIQVFPENGYLTITLAPADIYLQKDQQHFLEISIRFLKKRALLRSFYYQRSIQVSGLLKSADLKNQRLTILLEDVLYHSTLFPLDRAFYFAQVLRQRLIKRAAFYLPAEIFELYSPLILAKSVYRSEVRELFRNTGMAHLLSISGLHIGLLFWLGMGVVKQPGRFSERLLGWVYFPQFCQVLTLIGLWCYVGLLAFPIPALRAVVMLTLMMLLRWTGQAHASLQALLTTAFLFISVNPAVIYDLSFQLSFVAVLYIIISLPLLLPVSQKNFWHKMWKTGVNSSLITASVLLGIFPILAAHFQQLSLEPFWLNIVMLPVLAFLVLPVCFAAFFHSLFLLNAPPFLWLEKELFQLSEWSLKIWLEILNILHQWGSWGTFSVQIQWEGWQYSCYYLGTLLIYYLLYRKFRKAE